MVDLTKSREAIFNTLAKEGGAKVPILSSFNDLPELLRTERGLTYRDGFYYNFDPEKLVGKTGKIVFGSGKTADFKIKNHGIFVKNLPFKNAEKGIYGIDELADQGKISGKIKLFLDSAIPKSTGKKAKETFKKAANGKQDSFKLLIPVLAGLAALYLLFKVK